MSGKHQDNVKEKTFVNKKKQFCYFSVGIIGSIGQLQTGLRYDDKGKRRFAPQFKKNYFYSFPPYMTPDELQSKYEREKKQAEDKDPKLTNYEKIILENDFYKKKLQIPQDHIETQKKQPDDVSQAESNPLYTRGRKLILNEDDKKRSQSQQNLRVTSISAHQLNQLHSRNVSASTYNKFYKDWFANDKKKDEDEDQQVKGYPFVISKQADTVYSRYIPLRPEQNNLLIQSNVNKKQFQIQGSKYFMRNENAENGNYYKNHLLGNEKRWQQSMTSQKAYR